MRAYVFTDKALARYAGRFVWLSIDTENAANAAFLKKYPIHALPTLLVVDSKQQAVVMRYVGGATVPQLEKLLADGEHAFRAHGNSADALLSSADRLASQDKNAEAIAMYEKAIATAPKNWPRLGRAAESFTMTLMMNRESDRCATVSRDLYARLKSTTSGANVVSMGLGCALDIDAKNPARADLVKVLEADTRQAFDDAKVRSKMSGDDISGLYDALISARVDAKDDAEAKMLRGQWAAFLEREAAEAKTPEQRAVYDSHRVSAYLALNTPETAIPMLEQSEKDFPNDYNPPARLALAYKAMGRFDDALAASAIALKKAYGPRKIGIYRTRADIFTAKGDKAGARTTIEEAIAYAKALPEAEGTTHTIAALEKKLTEMPQ
jgi:tetratricopeptide (TPR) repeat protein